MSKYAEDKERIDKITELIANQEPVKEWVCIYWMAVAIGHILEWLVKHGVKTEKSEKVDKRQMTWKEYK